MRRAEVEVGEGRGSAEEIRVGGSGRAAAAAAGFCVLFCSVLQEGRPKRGLLHVAGTTCAVTAGGRNFALLAWSGLGAAAGYVSPGKVRPATPTTGIPAA